MKIKQGVASVALAVMLALTGVAVGAAPAQAHNTTYSHYSNCFITLDGRYQYCYFHCTASGIAEGYCQDHWRWWRVTWYA